MSDNIIDALPKLIGLDLETTGGSFSDRIVEIAILTYEYGILKDKFVERVNPEIHIPERVSQIHGITDEDVKDKPNFSEVVDHVMEKMSGSVFFGYNIIFDINVLSNELKRVKRSALDPKNLTLLDPFSIWKKHDPKTLGAAYNFFCGKTHDKAHDAFQDVSVTFEVLKAQLEKYDDMPKDVVSLGHYCYPKDPSWVCSSYHFVYDDKGEIICNFGKYKSKSLRELVIHKKSFCDWILEKEFPEDVKKLVSDAIDKD